MFSVPSAAALLELRTAEAALNKSCPTQWVDASSGIALTDSDCIRGLSIRALYGEPTVRLSASVAVCPVSPDCTDLSIRASVPDADMSAPSGDVVMSVPPPVLPDLLHGLTHLAQCSTCCVVATTAS